MKEKTKKGQYGYRNNLKKIQMAQVAFGAAMILAQLLARNWVDSQAGRNVLTVMAILTVLPTANVASPLIAAWRYKTPSLGFYQQVAAYEGKAAMVYDLVITSKETIMPMDAVAVHPSGIFAYCSKKSLRPEKAEAFLSSALAEQKLDFQVTVMTEEGAFMKKLESLREKSLKTEGEGKDGEKAGQAVALLKSLSM